MTGPGTKVPGLRSHAPGDRKEKEMRSASVAFAMALGIALCASPRTGWCSRAEIDFSSALPEAQLADAQPEPDVWLSTTSEPVRDSAPHESNTALAPTQASEGAAPVAPLPPSLLVGSAGIMIAGWATYRIKKHGL